MTTERAMTERAMTTEEREAGYRETGLWTDDPVGYLVSSQAARWPDRELFSFEGRRVSYGDFDAWVSTVAADLAGAGVQRGDRVMVMMPNCLEALVLQVAAFRIGAVDMPVIPIYREHEIRQILADSRPAAVAVASELGPRRPAAELDILLAELGQEPAVRYSVGAPRPGWRAVPASGTVRVSELPEPLPADQPVLLLYTSGTTSAPKGVLLTSRALLAHLRNYQQALGASDETVLLAGTPLSHLGGFISGVIFPAFLGARSVIMTSWQPDEAVPLIEREQVSLMMGAPVFLSDLVQRYEAGAAPAHRLSLFMCAGAAVHPSTIERAQAVGVTAVRVYGMTETAGVCTMASADDPVERRSRWDGHLIPGMEIEAADRDRRQLPPGQEGELRIRGPQLLTGYTDPGLTQAQIDADGWFYPGDIGVVDAQGWVRMSGRSKDIINRGGEKFSTMDIEAAIAAHPDVADVAVTAVPDARLGEAAGAWLVLRLGAVWAGPAPIIEHLEQRKLARQKIPVQWHVVAAIPTTASGKVQKNRLTELEDVAR
jgi:acyl-CoA synthetase (AMP-forming)/AMP-acid ligase II